MFPQAVNLSGALFSAEQRGGETGYATLLTKAVAKAAPVSGRAQWTQLTYQTARPLLEHEEEGRGPYRYYFLLRPSGTRFLLLGDHSSLPEQLLTHAGLWRSLSRPTIDVAGLVRGITEKPGQYSISTLYARVDAFGHALRTIALFGTDLANARLFRDMLPQLSPYRATLRDVRTRHEILTVGSRGEVGFHFAGGNSLARVDAALAFISQTGHMTWTTGND
ncbi:MAG TPA: hypothetical protein VJN18_05180 [Polyangiaceae bacterium]|nr:hypothetical protein [Polyangiaceae bacterium]